MSTSLYFELSILRNKAIVPWTSNLPDSTVRAKIQRDHSLVISTVLPAKSDSDAMFCLYSYQGLIIDRSLVY